jgi:hypothetical protein
VLVVCGAGGGIEWQEPQAGAAPLVATSTVPFWWSAVFTDVAVYPVWQFPQLVLVVCGAGGGIEWQEPQAGVPPPLVATSTVPFWWSAALTVVDE